ncbi:4-alpha-glucanotransferase [Clostridium formicaceticum]|uniref:4-alpha-glucanotransferase n=1 Tax=Clostridium formicaceticum TaxID=1497 RepID=A0AAC9RQE1_9CLOT|nr:4-alpha-glucanotransferase [Clostridium formicaceticum]AOY74900.1 4-alpha-glucanotransferase [Clostridium formicaceticum]ARE89305.1 4-alpha-glucanotransferase [Clostridium formicaceticum]
MNRSSGILMHITSLPSPYGIGSLGREAYEFIDFLEAAGQKFWQVLPITPIGYGDSPYQSLSTFAGNPLLIDLNLLREEGWLRTQDFEGIDFGSNKEKVDYDKIFQNKLPLLRKVFFRGKEKYKDKIADFRQKHQGWLEDYGLYMALKFHFNLKAWYQWEEGIKLRRESAIAGYKKKLKGEMDYWIFLQYLFYHQWEALKKYANSKGIKMIGDLPIYVAEDSVDTWASSEIFLLDAKKKPLQVAGCPPDAFSKSGQLWGNPLYRWEVLEKRGFDWWIERIAGSRRLYDVIRLDHFRGLESFWAVPYGEKTAEGGTWMKGPGMKLLKAIKEKLGKVDVIVEDLGFLTSEVIALREESGYPGMKVLQFAFDPGEESIYLPHNYVKNCVVYTGTHDNDTVMGWRQSENQKNIKFARQYLKLDEEEGYHWGFIRGAWSSVANLAVAPLQDFIGLSSEGRMNIPSTVGGNWRWRVKKEYLTEELSKKIYAITKLYYR